MAGVNKREVIVLDAVGRPIPGAIVEVASGTAPTPEVGHVSDARGHLHITLPPGRYLLRAATRDGGRGEIDVTGDEDEIIQIKIAKKQ